MIVDHMIDKHMCADVQRNSFGVSFQPYRKPVKEAEETNKICKSSDKFEEAKKSISRGYFWLFAVLISLIVGIQLTNEINAMSYLQPYLVLNNGLSPKASAYCIGMLSAFTTVGRIVNIFLTMKINTQTFLFINFALMIAAYSFIMIVGAYSLIGIYVGIILLVSESIHFLQPSRSIEESDKSLEFFVLIVIRFSLIGIWIK